MTNKYEKENNNYIQKISNLTIKLKNTTDELAELQNKNSSVGLDQMLESGDEGSSILEDQLDECKKIIEKLKQENKHLKEGEILAKKAEEFEAKNKALTHTIEIMKKKIEELKSESPKKSEDDFKEEIVKI